MKTDYTIVFVDIYYILKHSETSFYILYLLTYCKHNSFNFQNVNGNLSTLLDIYVTTSVTTFPTLRADHLVFIHSSTSPNRHPILPALSGTRDGNSPFRSSRQIVVRDKPVLFCTSLERIIRSGSC